MLLARQKICLVDVESLDVLINSREMPFLNDLLELRASQADDHILWLEVSVDDFADAMEVVQSHEYLFCYAPDERDWNPLIVIAFHDL